jgi:hypothetical protein
VETNEAFIVSVPCELKQLLFEKEKNRFRALRQPVIMTAKLAVAQMMMDVLYN